MPASPRTFLLFVAATVTVACSTATGSSGYVYVGDSVQPAQDALADAAVGVDTASGADTASAVDTTSGVDTLTASDMGAKDVGSSSGPDVGLQPDAIADVPFASDAQSGSSDGKGGADTIADVPAAFDVGTPDVVGFDVSFGDVASDAKCIALCQLIQAANCPTEQSYDACVSGCSTGLAMWPACTATLYAMVDCSLGQTITCGSNGKSAAPPACQAQVDATQKCFTSSSTGGCAGPSTCSADSSGGCGCTGCGGQYGMACAGDTCTCLANGAATSQTFSSAGVCQNPGVVMDAACKPAP